MPNGNRAAAFQAPSLTRVLTIGVRVDIRVHPRVASRSAIIPRSVERWRMPKTVHGPNKFRRVEASLVSSVHALTQAHFLLPPEPRRYRIHTERLSYEHKCGDEGPHYIHCPSRSLSLNYCLPSGSKVKEFEAKNAVDLCKRNDAIRHRVPSSKDKTALAPGIMKIGYYTAGGREENLAPARSPNPSRIGMSKCGSWQQRLATESKDSSNALDGSSHHATKNFGKKPHESSSKRSI
ncbi:hypothetical protein ARMGADRAFT_1040354 [Armillaria gallica]|uniref:Uncharacterized protein n=1 Tax=Armillaria gallica TaxID=47427 RepID=A0A2H3CTE5_ARMGA|nr:hypothetical protein ARMGADRAFT_1040354 [Armillaria gallica]